MTENQALKFNPNYMQINLLTKDAHFEVIEQMIANNLIENIDLREQESQGFLIANFTKEELKKFNAICPILLAIQGDEVLGYVIVGTEKSKGIHPVIDSMISDSKKALGKPSLPSSDRHIFIIQVCVDSSHRKKGVFKQLYTSLIEKYKKTYKLIITEVVTRNKRSFVAHERMGFEVIRSQNGIDHPHLMVCLRI